MKKMLDHGIVCRLVEALRIASDGFEEMIKEHLAEAKPLNKKTRPIDRVFSRKFVAEIRRRKKTALQLARAFEKAKSIQVTI
jgi:hypothetical protein